MVHTHAGIVVAAFLWSAPIALMSAELGTIVPENGGAMVWARAAFGAGSCRGDAIAFCAGVLQHVAACCSMLQRVAACCSVLQHVAACCSMLQRVAVFLAAATQLPFVRVCAATLPFQKTLSVSCSALQCVEVCGSVW